MKKLFILLLMFVFTAAMAHGEKSHSAHDAGVRDHGKKKHQMLHHMSNSSKDRGLILEIFKENESLHMAFINGDSNTIAHRANVISKLINKLKDNGLKKMLAMSKISSIKGDMSAKHIGHIYNEFSKHLVHLIKLNQLGATYKEFYCPMAKKSWIQNVVKMKKVQNPYLKNMRSCGSMKS